MKSGGNEWAWNWRRDIVDALIGAALIAVAFAAAGATEQILYVLLIVGALVGIGLMLEPNATAQPKGDIASQPPAETQPARPGPWAMAGSDAAIAEAASV